MMRKIIVGALALQLILLLLLLVIPTLGTSPLHWNYDGDYGIQAVGSGKYLEAADSVNAMLSEICSSYHPDEKAVQFNFSLLRSDQTLTILEISIRMGNEKDGYQWDFEEIWVEGSKKHIPQVTRIKQS